MLSSVATLEVAQKVWVRRQALWHLGIQMLPSNAGHLGIEMLADGACLFSHTLQQGVWNVVPAMVTKELMSEFGIQKSSCQRLGFWSGNVIFLSKTESSKELLAEEHVIGSSGPCRIETWYR